MSNSDLPKPTVSAHFDDATSRHDMPIEAEKMAEYFLSMTEETKCEEIVKKLCDEGLVVDQVLCTLMAAIASFLANCYADDEQRACSSFGHLSLYGHALLHEMIKEANEDVSDS